MKIKCKYYKKSKTINKFICAINTQYYNKEVFIKQLNGLCRCCIHNEANKIN